MTILNLLRETYENRQDSLFKKKKKKAILMTTLTDKNPKHTEFYFDTKSCFGDRTSVTNALDFSNTHTGVILG